MNPLKMPEAEVSLRLAFFLIQRGIAAGDVHVAIDGAQIRTSDTVHFAIEEFLRPAGLRARMLFRSGPR